MNRYFEPFVELVAPEGCDGVIRRTLALKPHVVVTRKHVSQGECVHRLERALLRGGFGRSLVHFRFREHRSFDPTTGKSKRIIWKLFSAPVE
jgi:hypothetical protein